MANYVDNTIEVTTTHPVLIDLLSQPLALMMSYLRPFAQLVNGLRIKLRRLGGAVECLMVKFLKWILKGSLC